MSNDKTAKKCVVRTTIPPDRELMFKALAKKRKIPPAKLFRIALLEYLDKSAAEYLLSS
jgi:hypothetical protein